MNDQPPGERSEALGSQAADQAWRPEHRLRRRPDFLRCYRRGRRIDSPGLRLYVARGEAEGPRIGVTASRKVGKAVVRQRTRRRVREIVRRWPQRGCLPPLDMVVHLHPAAAALSFLELQSSLESSLERALRVGAPRRGSPRRTRR